MTTAAQALERTHQLSRASRSGVIDRWIYVFTTASFVLVTLLGFVPDSLAKLAAVKAGQRPPFPIILHVHAVLMGSFLLLLLAQAILVATNRTDWHRRLGLAGMVLGPALVVVGFILVPTMYHWLWSLAQTAPAPARPSIEQTIRFLETVMLGQLQTGVVFPVLLLIGLVARKGNPDLHKRMMMLAVTPALGAAFDRIAWLPTTMPASPLSTEFFPILLVSPMLLWDLMRKRRLHMAYQIWLALYLSMVLVNFTLWDTPLWHGVARSLMGVGCRLPTCR